MTNMPKKEKAPSIRFKDFNKVWEQCKLEEITEKITKGTTPIDKKWIGPVNYIKTESIDKESGNLSITSNTSLEEHEGFLKRSQLKCDDVLFSIVGTLGRVGIVAEKDLPANTNQQIAILRLKRLNPYFALNVLKTPSIQMYYKTETTTGAQPSLSLWQINKMDITFPSDVEQNQIGAFFKNVDNLITLQQSKVMKLKNVKKAMFEKMFPQNGSNTPEIRFAGFTDSWEQRKLGEVGSTYTGLSGKSKVDFGHGEGRYVTYMNVFTSAISSAKMVEPIEIDTKQNEVKAGDVFFTTSSETPDEVGMSSVMLENWPNTYLNSFCFGYRPIEIFDNYYLAYMLRSDSVRENIVFLAQGISRYNISKNRVMEIEVPIPQMAEQRLLGDYFRNLDNLIALHQHKYEKLQNIKIACLKKMFV